MLDNPFGEEIFPNIQSKPPLVQLEAISSCLMACYLGEETDTHLATTSFQAEQPQLSEPFFIGEVLQPSDHFCGTSSGLALTGPSLSCTGAPELDAVLQVGSQESGVEGENHLPRPAGHASFDTAQDTIGFLGCERTLLAHVQFFIHHYPQVLLLSAALNPFIPQSVLILGIAPMQVQDLALGFVELQEVPMGPLLKPVQVPLDGIPSLNVEVNMQNPSITHSLLLEKHFS
ncbi:hypothetical protein QYF61_019810 [Mycteria americana]|uniref:Uncharacterized protein n=1 Tax=Mycteria americana TaxID=33587 RepID=A0AAN7MRR8_MYCAM|nr:hypothetical protein QYF61_019810 [Mycteria americana]